MNTGNLLFISSLISFISVLQFSVICSFTSLVKFIPKYATGFVVIVNGIIFFVSFSDDLLLVYKNTTDFYMLFLYPATLLHFYQFYQFFFQQNLQPLVISSHLQTVTIFAFFSPIWMAFLPLPIFLIGLARISSVMLKRGVVKWSPLSYS